MIDLRCKICSQTFKRPPIQMQETQICSICRKMSTNEQIEKIKNLRNQNNNLKTKNTIKQKHQTKKTLNQLHFNFSRNKEFKEYEIPKSREEIEKSMNDLKSIIEFELKDHPEALNKFIQSDIYSELLSEKNLEKIKKLI